MAEETSPTPESTPSPKAATPDAGATPALASGAAAVAGAGEPSKPEQPNARKLLAALSAKERKFLEREKGLGEREADLKTFNEVREALKSKNASRALELLGTDYLSLSELVASGSGGELTEEEKIQAAVDLALQTKEDAKAEAAKKAKADEDAAEEKKLGAVKQRYREALTAKLTEETARFKTTAALGEHGIGLAFDLMEAALERGQALPIEECLSLAEKHFVSKLGTPAEGNQDMGASAGNAENGTPIKTAARSRTITNVRTAQPTVLRRAGSEAEQRAAAVKRLAALEGLPE